MEVPLPSVEHWKELRWTRQWWARQRYARAVDSCDGYWWREMVKLWGILGLQWLHWRTEAAKSVSNLRSGWSQPRIGRKEDGIVAGCWWNGELGGGGVHVRNNHGTIAIIWYMRRPRNRSRQGILRTYLIFAVIRIVDLLTAQEQALAILAIWGILVSSWWQITYCCQGKVLLLCVYVTRHHFSATCSLFHLHRALVERGGAGWRIT